MPSLSDRVTQCREELRLSQKELAQRITRLGFPFSQQGVDRLEKRATSRPHCLPELARALEVSEEWLRTGKGQRERGIGVDLDEPKLRAAIDTAVEIGYRAGTDAFLARVIQAYAEAVPVEERYSARGRKTPIIQLDKK